jgi:cytochrome c peroxidase
MKNSFMKYLLCFLSLGIFLVGLSFSVFAEIDGEAELQKIELGKKIFFDTNLSVNGAQSCGSCHDPAVGFTSTDSEINAHGAVEPGAVPDRFGNRKPPAAAYAGDSPLLHYDPDYDAGKGSWIGGMFWDGRASGWKLGDTLAEQAMGPFMNPLEMNMPNKRLVCIRISISNYAELFEEVWGPGSLDFVKDTAGTYKKIARSIAAYEKSSEVNSFTSKFDLFWDNARAAGKNVTLITAAGIPGGMGGGGGMGCGGMGCGTGMGMPEDNPARWEHYKGLGLTDEELKGLAIFNDPNRANCASCHSLAAGSAGYPLFTDFSYHNLGIPRNSENPFYLMPKKWNTDGVVWVDYGLGGFLKSAGYAPEVYETELGKFKTPTLKNIDLRPYPEFVKAFGHNGFFKNLDAMDGIIHFYAWRAMMDNMGGGMGGGMAPNPNMFPAPELDKNRIVMQPFNFMMDGAKIVAFLKTLSDGYFQR